MYWPHRQGLKDIQASVSHAIYDMFVLFSMTNIKLVGSVLWKRARACFSLPMVLMQRVPGLQAQRTQLRWEKEDVSTDR